MISLDISVDFWMANRSAENRERLVSTYAYLCTRGARKFLRAGLERSDLEQVAAIGLLKASDRYNAAMSTPFEAYAWLFIVGELMHHVRDCERMVRPPRRLRTLERKWQKLWDGLVVTLGRAPRDEELALALQTDIATIVELRECRARAITDSLDSTTSPQVASALLDVDCVLDRLLIESALEALNETERSIILGVYAKGYSQFEIAQRLGYSQRHISRLHKAALEKMLPVWVQK
ncbi:MAG: sigma-70 family RNA polymerase sigma factor [Candidatus Eremiobacteraeota bacterium]|nr:sigma-70 family RNA polymerase sigma factor [Candidatus Eremiobacteraeota bacterium]